MLTESKINTNYLNFIKYLEKYNCYSDEMIKELGEKIKLAPYTMQKDWGGAEPGGMIDVTLNILCKIGVEINNTFKNNEGNKINHPFLAVNQEMLMRVLLLLNIAKAEMFVENSSEWHKKNLGKMYEFAENKTKLNLGQRSLFLCQKYGIKLEEEEFEAFLSIDDSDEKGEMYQTPLYSIVKAAKMFTMVELRKKYLSTVETNVKEI